MKQELGVEIIDWNDIKNTVFRSNRELYHIINQLQLKKKLHFLKVNYPFGFSIIKDGKIDKKYFSEKDYHLIERELSYSEIPLGLLLNKVSEVFVHADSRVIPLNILYPGELFGIFETLNFLYGIQNKKAVWNVSSGVRSIFMLPKINNQIGHLRLKKEFGVKCDAPKNISEHWTVFYELANSDVLNEKWISEVIFFTKDWFNEKLFNSLEWLKFKDYLCQISWQQSQFLLENSTSGLGQFLQGNKMPSLIWQTLTKAMIKRKIKPPRPYIIDTVKYLFAIAKGIGIAFVPGNQDQLIAPTNMIQKAYTDIYRLNLEKYIPTIMQPAMLSEKNKIVYYSLQCPTLLEGHPDDKIKNEQKTKGKVKQTDDRLSGQHDEHRLISDLRKIQELLETLYRYCNQHRLQETSDLAFVNEVIFRSFHRTQDARYNIISPIEIFTKDETFKSSTFTNFRFCSTSSFFNGCISIQRY